MIIMDRSYKVKDIIEMYNTPKGEPLCLETTFPTQRPAGQWTTEQKSELIRTAIYGDPVPPVYLTHDESDITYPMQVLDGQHRLRTFIDFANVLSVGYINPLSLSKGK